MPFAILKSIYAVNSEDTVHTASSLLKNESNKKWKTASNDKSAYVIIQLENELTITGIDIGNEHSAFVEVLVGKTKKCNEFKEILLTSSFMTPIESKNSSNINRVRCFPKDQLIESVTKEKWDLIKFVCTQPFNRHCQYGLSFVKIHVTEPKDNKPLVPEKFLQQNKTDEQTSNQVEKFIGKFKLREESPDSESENTTGLFNRWRDRSNTTENIKKPLIGSTAATIREASTPHILKRTAESLKPTIIIPKGDKNPIDVEAVDKKRLLDRNRNELLYDETDDRPNDKYERKISLDQERISKEKSTEKKLKEKHNKESRKESETSKLARKNESHSSTSSKFKKNVDDDKEADEKLKALTPKIEKPIYKVSNINNSAKKRLSSPGCSNSPSKKIKNEKELNYKPFKRLLEGVVLTISGIQNPDRSDIRSKALSLGAKYKPDWENSCTHLICAFQNTPKYFQVQQANGRIVTKKWIESCYKSKKRLPWRRYALDSSEKDQPESEEEILDITMKPTCLKQSPSKSPSPELETLTKKHLSPAPIKKRSDSHENTLFRYDLGREDDLKDETYHMLSSGSDTEEEIEKVRQKQELVVAHNNKDSPEEITKEIDKKEIIDDIYEVSTEEDEFTKKRREQRDSKYFFQNKNFYLTTKLSSVDKMKLKSIIEQYQGEIIESLRQANYIISKESLEISNIQGIVVSPLWIYECNDMECLIPTERYLS